VAALVGAWFGFDFGRTLGGPGLGLVLAALGALLCSIVLGDAVERLLGRLSGRRRSG
jgi:high-affinity Fe2+/Pb2+ permease